MAQRKDSAGSGDDGAMRVDATLVQQLAELLTENQLTEIEVEDGDRKIRVARHAVRDLLTSSPAFNALPAPVHHDIARDTAQVAPAAAEEVSGETIKSPMVGTAYLSSEPGAQPFAEVGDTVKAGDTLLIVEAMKVMNPITAPSGGVLKKVFVADGQPVEFDQPLVIIG